MYILKNAITSILRNKSRNILIIIVVAVIAAACTITLSIRNSANKIVKAYEEKYEVEATIGMNRQSLTANFNGSEDDTEKKSQEEMIEAFNNIESLTEDEIISYGTSDYVKNYYYYYQIGINAKDIEEATDSLVKETTTTETTTRTEKFASMPDGGMPGGFNGGGSKTTTSKQTTKTEKIYNDKASSGAFTLFGYTSYDSMSDFISGKYTIVEGEVSSDFSGNGVVISEELATLNDLSVGDTITLVSPNNTKKTYEVIITGIFTENSDESSDMTSMFTSSVNYIFTNTAVVKAILELDTDLSATITPTFVLTSKDVVDAFSEEVSSKGLSEYYTVNNNVSEIESATKSIVSIKSFAITFLIITLIIGGVVLLVINMINIRERRYEIGVLRTIGMKKISVIFQFMSELLIVCLFGLIVGAGIGATSSVKVANYLLSNEISNSQSEMTTIDQNFGGHGNVTMSKSMGVSNISEVSEINAVVDMKVLGELLLIGVGLTVVSSVASCVSIARFSPLKILKERS